jgi:hypothetical protein
MDRSLAMLEQLCNRLRGEDAAIRGRVAIVHGDIRYDDAGCQFPLIIAAGNVLHSFLERQDQRAWLRNVRRHLAPAGAFCFDVFQFEYKRLNASAETWNLEPDRTDLRSGQKIRCYSRCAQEPELQRFRVDYRWSIDDGSGAGRSEQTASVMQRWFTRGELENLLELEDFHIEDYWGSFGREPFGRGSRFHVIRASAI